MAPLLLLLAACGRSAPDTAAEALDYTPSSARLHRLTDVQYRNAALDLTGVAYTGDLPDDYRLYGYATVGGGEASMAPVELEQVETAAWTIATAAVPDAAARDRFVGCAVGAPLGAPDGGDPEACVRGWVAGFGRLAWRRPLTGEELGEMVALFDGVATGMEDPTLAVQATLAAFLLSPNFLYRVELGEDDPEHPGHRRLTAYELATRAAFFLTNAPPDEALWLAAERGDLAADAELRAHAERLLDTERGREAMIGFWDETMGLYEMDLVAKDPVMFPQFTDALREAMREETRLLFADVALDGDADVGELFTTGRAFVNAELGAVYGVTVGGEALQPVDLPATAERGGVLGRAAFLAMNANATFNSPTHRGKHVRTRLLCQDIPPPPAGTPSLDEVSTEGTLRDRLDQHMADPACNSCHVLMDPIGFGFEHFDPIGQWRTLDNGLPIDATGDLDGAAYDGADELGVALAAHPGLAACFTRQLYRHARGELEGANDEVVLDALTADFEADDRRIRALALSVILSEGFRRIGAPAAEGCTADQAGVSRPCASDCGSGEETCDGTSWVGCSAPAATDEACDGVDNDCDGAADEGVLRACETATGPGVQECLSAQWQACVGPDAPVETCNGLDDDGDGAVDDGLEVFFDEITFGTLTAAHESCDAATDAGTGACHAAIHRTCATSGCGSSGFALVAEDEAQGTVALACLSGDQGVPVSTSFTELAAYHGGCTASSPRGPDCFAAVNRYCAARGQVTGYGPVEYSGDYALVVCTPGATTFATGYSALVGFASVCDGVTERMGQNCDRAFHDWCQAQGYASGFGPLENSGDTAYAACVGGS